MSVRDIVLDLLQSKQWINAQDFEEALPPGTEGHLSWPQRLRGLRQEGFKVIKRKKEGTKHTWEYSILVEEKQLEFV